MKDIVALKENRDYRRLYGRGKSFVSPVLVTYVMKNKLPYCRVGITTGKKIGNAVKRNRARRVIRAAYRENSGSVRGGYDIVFVARGKTARKKSTEIASVMRGQLVNAGVIDR